MLKPLWYGAGDPRLQDVARKDWWYRKDFTVPERFAGKPSRRWCSTASTMNARSGSTARRSAPTPACSAASGSTWPRPCVPGQTNRLAVRIARMPDVIAPLVPRTDGQGVVNDATHFLRGIELTPKTLKEFKSPTNWGWDWGVNIWTLGIWKDVRLEATGPARIDWTRVQTALADDHAKAIVTARLEIDSQTDLPAQADFRVFGRRARRPASRSMPR